MFKSWLSTSKTEIATHRFSTGRTCPPYKMDTVCVPFSSHQRLTLLYRFLMPRSSARFGGTPFSTNNSPSRPLEDYVLADLEHFRSQLEWSAPSISGQVQASLKTRLKNATTIVSYHHAGQAVPTYHEINSMLFDIVFCLDIYLHFVTSPCDSTGLAVPVDGLPEYARTHRFLDSIYCTCSVKTGVDKSVHIFVPRGEGSLNKGDVCIGCVDWSTRLACPTFGTYLSCFDCL